MPVAASSADTAAARGVPWIRARWIASTDFFVREQLEVFGVHAPTLPAGRVHTETFVEAAAPEFERDAAREVMVAFEVE